MNLNSESNNFLNGIWKYVLIILLLAGTIASCDQITGSGDDSDTTDPPETDPEPQVEAVSISNFSVSDDLISEGETVTLSWEVTGDEPITLTLEPGSIDVSGETSRDVTPGEDITYRLVAENDAGSDQRDVSVRVIPAGVVAIEVEVSGLPAGVKANIAVTDHQHYTQWVTENTALTELPAGSYTVVAAPVNSSGSSYIPSEYIQTVDVAKSYSNTSIVQLNYIFSNESFYADQPDLQACEEGSITEETKERGLMYLNFIRALAGLPPVGYDHSSDDMVQKAALMMAANSDLSHFPPEDWHCYTEAGADAAETSNLAIDLRNDEINATAEYFMALYADDWRVTSLGHRRWLLDPFLSEVAIGMVEGTPITGSFSNAAGNAVRVIGAPQADIGNLELPFIAYPRGDFPSELLTNDWFLSFSVLADNRSKFGANEQVDFSSAEITVTENESNLTMTITEIMIDDTPFGLPNNLQWKVPDLRSNRSYTITIENVTVNDQNRDYSYEFQLL